MRKVVFTLILFSVVFASGIKVTLSVGGFLGNYGDYNSFVSYENSWLKFNNDDWAAYQQDLGFIKNFSSQKGKINDLSFSLPVSLRISKEMKGGEVFAEVFYIQGEATSNTNFSYNIVFSDNSSSSLSYKYSPFKLKASFLSFGLGADKRLLTRGLFKLNLEAGIGFCYVNFSYLNDLTARMELSDYWLEVQNKVNMDGKGPGVYGYGALRFPIIEKGRISISLSGGYYGMKIFSIKGDSSLVYSVKDSSGYSLETDDSWSGEWFMKEVSISTWWGDIKYRYPSNYSKDLGDNIKNVGKFAPFVYGPFLSISFGYNF